MNGWAYVQYGKVLLVHHVEENENGKDAYMELIGTKKRLRMDWLVRYDMIEQLERSQE
jgi:hypothetical protein